MQNDSTILTEAHRRTKEFAKELSADGFPDDVIVGDALMGAGSNGYGQLGGSERLVRALRRFADVIEAGGKPGLEH